MSSIVEGYEYDIFISYRQKDNKYDGWVTEFVENLRKDLEATFKEEISIYFDENTLDGILDTYNVDKSLKNKINCLIFIPIISQTYCDPKSFAWQYEFVAFNKAASNDLIGSNITLSNGNVTGRILPVKIHVLDEIDKTLLESELGGSIRSVEFIFKTPGVNRPLKPDDSRTENLNHTYYRDQINKVANAVKEIINSMKYQENDVRDMTQKKISLKNNSGNIKSKSKFKFAVWAFIIVGIAISSYFFLLTFSRTTEENADKSIAVLPFEYLGNDPRQQYISGSMSNEIINQLIKIEGLLISEGDSSMRSKVSEHSIRNIATKLGVNYVLYGNVTISDNKVRVTVRLANGKNERILWSEPYNREWTANNFLDIVSEIAQQVAENMNVAINPEVKHRIEAKRTLNTEAYTLFLQANDNMKRGLTSDKERLMLERAISLDQGFADAYALLANWWIYSAENDPSIKREKVLGEAESLLAKALNLDKNSYLAHSSLVTIRLWYYWDFQSVEKETRIINELVPSISSFYSSHIDYLIASGQSHEALATAQKSFNTDKTFNFNWIQLAQALYFNDMQDSAVATMETALRLFPDDLTVIIFAVRIYVFCSRFSEAISLAEKSSNAIPSDHPFFQSYLGIAYLNTGNWHKSDTLLNELLIKCNASSSGTLAYLGAILCTSMDEKDKALTLLERAYTEKSPELYWINVDPLFKPLHGDPRFENILQKIGFHN